MAKDEFNVNVGSVRAYGLLHVLYGRGWREKFTRDERRGVVKVVDDMLDKGFIDFDSTVPWPKLTDSLFKPKAFTSGKLVCVYTGDQTYDVKFSNGNSVGTFYRESDGYFVLSPNMTPEKGFIDSTTLREIAAALDVLNKEWEDEINAHFNGVPRG